MSETKGDADFAVLYRQNFAALCERIRRRFGAGPPEPEEAVQAAFERFAALPDRTQIRNQAGFIYRSAVNYVLDYRRRESVSRRASAEILAFEKSAPPADHDVSRVLEAREELAAVVTAIQNLESRRREVLLLRSVEELSCAEIARRMKLSPTRVIQLYAEAVAACAKALREREGGGQ